MPAKKTASKRRKKAPASRKKAVARKSVARKRKVSKKKVAPVRRKKAAAKKKAVSKKTAAKKKPSRKKKSAGKKVSRKKVDRKKVSRKKVSRKKVSRKKPAARKASKKKTAPRKVGHKKAASKKKASSKRSAVKKATTRKKPVAAKAPVRRPRPRPRSRSRGNVLAGPIHGIEPYKPDRGEEYMSADQQEHFREILSAWKTELMFEVDRTVHHMQDEAANFPDPNDRATQESEFGLELRTRDRERKLLRKIDSALTRIDDGTYGYCDETGEEIGLKRLEARPVATLSLEAQERRELAERQFRDRDDRYR